MTLYRLLPYIAAVLLSAGCSRSAVDFEIDNPTDAPLTLSIDDQQHVIAPHTAVPISLEPGQYRLQSGKIGNVRMVVYAGGIGGLINPTLGEYVIVTEQYVTSKTNSGGLVSKVELNDVEIEGPYVKATGLLIPRRWDVGLLGELPSMVVSNSPDTSSDYRTKLYNVPGFFAYLDAEDDLRAAFGPDGYKAPDAKVEFTPATLPELPAAFEDKGKPMRDLYAQYLAASDAGEQKRLKKASLKLWQDFVTAQGKLNGKIPVPDGVKATKFSSQFFDLWAQPAVILPDPAPAG
ncbi:TPA: hypothetical protein UMB92_002037 [Stenotrophomonas maltophilia]|uniref:hypothetical protein n=1 Tax=Stenotrophomonas maltophilia TaxID=40324 RepID=UPI0015DFF251|nr:hypothetical protein [Stenotrophomonas maltophilia]MBA0446696.1 hypothetical protein [Stenotrophomonas maltophilia]HEL2979184.1 hypothetical protein [Stenotrophomonas maltophilia]